MEREEVQGREGRDQWNCPHAVVKLKHLERRVYDSSAAVLSKQRSQTPVFPVNDTTPQPAWTSHGATPFVYILYVLEQTPLLPPVLSLFAFSSTYCFLSLWWYLWLRDHPTLTWSVPAKVLLKNKKKLAISRSHCRSKGFCCLGYRYHYDGHSLVSTTRMRNGVHCFYPVTVWIVRMGGPCLCTSRSHCLQVLQTQCGAEHSRAAYSRHKTHTCLRSFRLLSL